MNKVSRRSFLQMAGLTAGAAFLAACAVPAAAPAAESTGGEAAAPSGAKVEMEAWSQMTDVDQESIKGIIDNYNATEHQERTSHIRVHCQTQGSQSDDKLLTAVAGGNPPDLHYADRFTVPQFAHQGFFTDINDLAVAAGVTKDQYFDFAWEETIYKDHIYALSFDTDTPRAVVQQGPHGEGRPRPREAADNAGRTETGYGSPDREERQRRHHPVWLPPVLWTRRGCTPGASTFGGEFQDPATKKITFADPNIVKSMEYMKAFVEEIGVQDLDAIVAACAGGRLQR